MSQPQDLVKKGDSDTLGKVDGIDMSTFSQILEMDEPDEPFSSPLVFDFFDQVTNTFEEMDQALEEKDLATLSNLGHFLKGSSATLGLTHLKDGCEKIQQYGKMLDLDGQPEADEDVCVKVIGEALKKIKEDFVVVKVALRNYYGEEETKKP